MTLDKHAVMSQVNVWCSLFRNTHGSLQGGERQVLAANFYAAAESIGMDTKEFVAAASRCSISLEFFPVPAVLVKTALEMRANMPAAPLKALPEPKPSPRRALFVHLSEMAARGDISYDEAAERMDAALAEEGMAVELPPLLKKAADANRAAGERKKSCPFRNASRMALDRS